MTKIKPIKSIVLSLFLLLSLTSCVNTGLKLVNKMAKSGNFQAFNNISYGEQPENTLNILIPNNQIIKATIIFFYGGCWGHCTDFDKDDYLFVAETLSKQGYAVVVPDYRQYPEVNFDSIIQDARDATIWTINHLKDYNINNDNVFLMGHSSGAHIAAMLSDNEKYLASRLVNITGFIGLAGPYDFYPFNDQYMYKLFSPENDYFNALPINFINGNEPPHLIMHGLKDTTVFIHNPNNLAKKLQDNGVETSKLLLEKTSHAKILIELAKPFRKNSPVLKGINEFIEEHTQ